MIDLLEDETVQVDEVARDVQRAELTLAFAVDRLAGGDAVDQQAGFGERGPAHHDGGAAAIDTLVPPHRDEQRLLLGREHGASVQRLQQWAKLVHAVTPEAECQLSAKPPP